MKRKHSRLVVASLLLVLVATPTLAAGGAATFKSKCAPCHGVTGAADTTMGKKLAIRNLGSKEVQEQTDAAILNIISKGKGKMPVYGGKIDEAGLKDLVAHIRTFAKK